MGNVVRGVLAGAVMLSASWWGASGIAAGAEPIGPHQHFIGVVNGRHKGATVFTACAGPVTPGRTGPIVGGTLAVKQVAKGHGRTGPLSQVYAWFVQDASGPPPKMAVFADYGVEQPVPDGVQVPCDGTGEVEFSPCPYLAPCVAGWRPDVVPVRFVNIAV